MWNRRLIDWWDRFCGNFWIDNYFRILRGTRTWRLRYIFLKYPVYKNNKVFFRIKDYLFPTNFLKKVYKHYHLKRSFSVLNPKEIVLGVLLSEKSTFPIEILKILFNTACKKAFLSIFPHILHKINIDLF